ncbi:hypothetical protein T459_02723 [Capsicum annuum]|uniref:Uncharacterized protein n=1 Tax=Capsicum annuum TaxID=4072 RepID=A0A2G3AKS9_CAPAN|nr:hypothetical protein T459_02723 [Capsicum annuum]
MADNNFSDEFIMTRNKGSIVLHAIRSLAKFLLVLDQCIQDDIKVGGAIIKQQLGDFGKPWGVCARAAIGRVLCFLRCKDDNANYA